MKRYSGFSLMIAAVMLLAGCTGGDSAPAPTNVTAVAGDSSIAVSWDMASGVQYWVFFAPAASVTPDTCPSIPGCQIITGASSPLLISAPLQGGPTGFTTNGSVVGLTNGTTYSITINGRTSGGPGGSGSPSVPAIPRLAGNTNTWSAGTTLGAGDSLRGVTYGTATVAGVAGNVFVAVGDNGALFSSAIPTPGSNILNWIVPTGYVNAGVNLNAITSYGTTYVAAGAGGVVLLSTDAITWTQETTNTTNDLQAIASNGAGGYVAVGANGTILTSSGGATWTAQTSGTTNTLYGVIYANGKYVAVGAAGTLLTSPDGATWTPVSSGTSADLKGVAYGGQTTTNGIISGVNTFVVIGNAGTAGGNAGTLVTSVDGGLTWQPRTSISNLNLNAVTYGHQFIAVGDSGGIYTSIDGLNWAAQTSASGNLYAITHGRCDYSTVGGAGLNLYSI